ncbi:MAG: DUF1847 domain-containing protein, partial [Chloroflexota bacterium]|nr:DUF1847 domain-containing protein [Chloroflexota bacterium]
RVMSISASIESKGYMKLMRLEELIEFVRQMRFERLEVAFCIGFRMKRVLYMKFYQWSLRLNL